MKTMIRMMGSLYGTTGLLFSLLLWYVIIYNACGFQSLLEPFDLGSFRLFYLLLIVNLISAAFAAVFEEHRLNILLYSSALVVLLSGGYLYLYYFNGTMSMGEGEDYVPNKAMYSRLNKGPLARMPAFDFAVRVVEPENRKNHAELVSRGAVTVLGPGGLTMNGFAVHFVKTGPAPLFHITIPDQSSVEEAYIKLNLAPPYKEDSFTFLYLPYEFFVRRTRDDGPFIINVRRGKLSLHEGSIAIGESVKVEGIILTLKNARSYAMLTVQRYPGLRLFIVSLAIFVSILGIAIFSRTKRTGRAEN